MAELPEINQLLDPQSVLKEGGIRQGATVADFGCGATGHFVFPAARIVGSEAKVYAIDIQKGVISAIESRMKLENVHNIEPLWGDFERTKGVMVPDQTFDLSLLVNNLFLAAKREEMAKEIFRTTKSGGKLVVVDWSEAQTPIGPSVEKRVSAKIAKDLFGRFGFTFDHDFVAGQYHWGVVFTRN